MAFFFRSLTRYPSSLMGGLLAYWTLNESSGNRLDSSGNNNTMIQTGSVTGAAGFGNMGSVSVVEIAKLYNNGNGQQYPFNLNP